MLKSRANPRVSYYRGLHFGRGHFHRYDCWEREQDICALRKRARTTVLTRLNTAITCLQIPDLGGAAPTSSKFVWLSTRLC